MMVSADNDSRRAGTIWTFDLGGAIPVILPLCSAVFCRVGMEAAPELAEAMGGRGLTEILQRYESGRRCYAARVDGQIAAYGWVSFDEELIGELNLRLRLLPSEAYIWNCATLPAFRQNNLYSALLAYILAILQKEHLSRVWIGADFDNIPSQRGIAHAGFTYVADLILARVLTLRQTWVQGRPNIPEGLVREARRAFLNDRDTVWSKVISSKKT